MFESPIHANANPTHIKHKTITISARLQYAAPYLPYTDQYTVPLKIVSHYVQVLKVVFGEVKLFVMIGRLADHQMTISSSPGVFRASSCKRQQPH